MGIGTPTIVYTRIDAIHSDFRIETLVTSDGEYIVASSIDLQALEPVTELVEGVSQCKGLQTEVVTLLKEAV